MYVFCSYNLSYFVIYLPKIIKIGGNLTKFGQKQFCTVSFETQCIVDCTPIVQLYIAAYCIICQLVI